MEVIVIDSDAFLALVKKVLEQLNASSPGNEAKWLDTTSAMKKLGIKSKTTLQKLRNSGAIKFSMPMKKVIIYDAQSIDAYLEKHAHDIF